ncbi:WD40-repeat-containing domain protein [Trametes maxima]|nr:WD40-repeat-containing domain protein [Trametes maxima]
MSFPAAHSHGVAQVAFTPDGTLLATSDLGGKMCVWEVHTGQLLHYYTPGTSILSLIWANPSSLYCGLGDGTLIFLDFGEHEINLTGSWSHAYPVEHLALTGTRLASGGHGEVFIWRISDPGDASEDPDLSMERELGPPVKSEGEEVLVTGLHWNTAQTHATQGHVLIVTYMSQGIYLFNSEDWTVLRRFGEVAPGYMARLGLSPDGTHLVVSNLVYGFDIYDLNTGTLALAVSHDNGEEYPVPVLYIHGGRAIIGGSTVGSLNIWYVDCSPPMRMPPLSVPGASQFFAYSVIRLTMTWGPDGKQVLSLAVCKNYHASNSTRIYS